MAPDVPSRAQRRTALHENALRRAQRARDGASVWENRFALLRLIVLVCLLAGLSAVWPWLATAARISASAFSILAAIAVVLVHLRARRARDRWNGLAASYALTCSRHARNFTEIEKAGNPWSRNPSVPAGHPYAHDLDICEKLFPLLDTCSTPAGSRLLLEELLSAGMEPPEEPLRASRLRRAQALARRTALLRRLESFRLSDENVANYLREREETSAPSGDRIPPQVSRMAMVAALVGVIAWLAWPLPAFLSYLRDGNGERFVQMLLWYSLLPMAGILAFRPIAAAADGILRTARASRLFLKQLGPLASHSDFKTLSCFSQNAQRTLNLLGLAVDLVSVRNNPVLWLILHAILPWDSLACLFLLFTVRRSSSSLEKWQEELAELDALAAVGRFASENPHCRFVGKTETSSPETLLELENGGHPLLPASVMVANSLRLTRESYLMLLTGSNMSGKSTFLRTVGINLVLHAMGAPVCATALATPLRRVLCAIRVDDSLSEGTSYFYAEVRRLKQMLDTLQSCHERNLPCLFLVDEIFRGTNNRERFIGSAAVLGALLDSGQPGIVSTHDLALTELERTKSHLRNFHFREHVEEGKLVFDYLLREGPCPTTNALRIMRDAGLPVPDVGAPGAVGVSPS